MTRRSRRDPESGDGDRGVLILWAVLAALQGLGWYLLLARGG